MTLNELAYKGGRALIKEYTDKIAEIKALLRSGKSKLNKKVKKKLSPARRRAIMKNLKKAQAARRAQRKDGLKGYNG
jgi:hypothetical protein